MLVVVVPLFSNASGVMVVLFHGASDAIVVVWYGASDAMVVVWYGGSGAMLVSHIATDPFPPVMSTTAVWGRVDLWNESVVLFFYSIGGAGGNVLLPSRGDL